VAATMGVCPSVAGYADLCIAMFDILAILMENKG
jgi:hypothetical protein